MPLSGTMWSVDTNCNNLHFLLLLYAWTFRFGFNEHCLNIQISIQWKLPKYSDSMKTGRTFRFGFNENRLTAISGPMWSLDTYHFLAARSLLISLYIAIQANFQAGRIIIMTTIMLMIPIMSINCISLILTTKGGAFPNLWTVGLRQERVKFFLDAIASHPSSLKIRVGVPKKHFLK